jgi:hypothetical protein
MRTLVAAVTAALFVAGCSAAAAPTPQIIYVTPPPSSPAPVPTPIVIYVTPAPTASAVAHVLDGTVALSDPNGWTYVTSGNQSLCQVQDGFSDLAVGAPITVKDQAGTIIGTGSFAMGTYANGACAVPFHVDGLPDAPFYSLEIGRRPALAYSRADLESHGWKLDLTLGG